MDPRTFDTLTRAVAAPGAPGPRRRLLGLPLGLLLAALLDGQALRAQDDDHGSSHRRQRRRARHQHDPGQDKAKRKGKRKGKGKGVGRPAAGCPDSRISCWVPSDDGGCLGIAYGFGPVGQCWHWDSGCCPCLSNDQAYWTDLCNKTVPEVCNGRCWAQIDSILNCGLWDYRC